MVELGHASGIAPRWIATIASILARLAVVGRTAFEEQAMPESFDPYRKWLGIPEGSRPPTYYQLLAIAPGEKDPDVINAAVVQRCAYVRNFQAGKFADDATRVLNEIAAAKACLVDPVKRAAYDAELKAKEPPKPRPRSVAAAPAAPIAPAFDPLAQAVAMTMDAPWTSPLGQMPTRKQGLPPWGVAVAIGTTVVVVLLIVVIVLSVGGDKHPVAATDPTAIGEAMTIGEPTASDSGTMPEAVAAVVSPLASGGAATSAEASTPAVQDAPPGAITAEAGASPSPESPEAGHPSAATTNAPASSEPASRYLDELEPRELRMLDFDASRITDPQLARQAIYGRLPVFVGDAVDQHPLWMHPPRSGNAPAHVAYHIGGNWRRLVATAAISKVPDITRSATPLTFRVVADGRELWASLPLRERGEQESCELDVSGVQRLELFVDCPGDCNGGYAVWIAPRLDHETPGEPSVPATSPIDLLALVDAKRDATTGAWRMEDGVLNSSDVRSACLQLPLSPPGDYDLTYSVEPGPKHDALFLGLVVGGRPCMLVLDGWNGAASGLHLIDGLGADANASTHRDSALLNTGQQNTVLVRVRQSGIVQMAVNGRTVMSWRGTPGQLSHEDDWARLRDRKKLFIGGHFGFKFHKLELQSRDAAAKPIPSLTHDEAIAAIRQAGGTVEPYQVLGQPALKLTMSGAGFADEHFALLRFLPEVRQLYAGGSRITDTGMAHLGGLTSLEALGLENTSISDMGVEHLAGLDRITAVNFGYTGITNDGLASMQGWTELSSLGLEGTAVTDTALPVLRKLPKLAGLIITGTKVTKSGARRWRSAMPKCNISGP
jgi:hypothetical protein